MQQLSLQSLIADSRIIVAEIIKGSFFNTNQNLTGRDC